MNGWFGIRYPSFADLEEYAESMGVGVIMTQTNIACFIHADAIMIPKRMGYLESCWSLAHELGHLVQHTGPRGELLWSKDEAQANRWAAQALIPVSRIRCHQNACEDTMIAALSSHYETIPFQNCHVRELARNIAHIRLLALGDSREYQDLLRLSI